MGERNPQLHMKHCNRARRQLRDSGRHDVFWHDDDDIPGSDDEYDLDDEYWDCRQDEAQEEEERKGRDKFAMVDGLRKIRELKNVRVPLPPLSRLKRDNPNCKLDVFPKWLGNSVRDGRLVVDRYVNLDRFGKMVFLCEGENSVVSLARFESNKRYYCLKGIKKNWIYKTRSFDIVERQLKVHLGVSSRFIANVFRVFDHPSFVFLMQEYCLGGTLAMLIKRRALPPFAAGKLTFDEARFYMAETASALNYLHSHDIIHRNLLLENIGISWNGHVKLLGFGRAVQVDRWKRFVRTGDKDVYGTIDSVAPELIPPRLADPFTILADRMRAKRLARYEEEDRIWRQTNPVEFGSQVEEKDGSQCSQATDEEYGEDDNCDTGDTSLSMAPNPESLHLYHSFESDWWSLGVMLYRIINGHMPYGECAFASDSDVTRRILFDARIPPFWRTKRTARLHEKQGVTELLNGLLILDQNRRWNFDQLADSLFFDGFVGDWMLVHKLVPPHVPPLGQVEADTSAYANTQRAKNKEMKIGVYPEELQTKPGQREVSYNYFAAACRDVMTHQLSKHTLRSRQQVEDRQQASQNTRNVRQDLPESRTFKKLQKGYALLQEKRKYQHRVQRENRNACKK